MYLYAILLVFLLFLLSVHKLASDANSKMNIVFDNILVIILLEYIIVADLVTSVHFHAAMVRLSLKSI